LCTLARALLAKLLAWLLRLLGRRTPALSAAPAPSLPPAIDTRIAALTERAQENARDSQALERALRTSKAQLAVHVAAREQRRQQLETHDAERQRNMAARIAELSAFVAPVELEIGAPAVPPGMVLLLRPRGAPWHEPVEGPLPVDELSPAGLRANLEQLRDRHPAELTRRVIAALCSARNQILDLSERARKAHEQRLADLANARIPDAEPLRQREGASAQRELARRSGPLIDEAATRLEKLLDDVRLAWESRLEGCAGVEQLRAEAAAIENGAEHRLTIAYDELREHMTLQCVRLVLDLARSFRQELVQKRLAVARGISPKTDAAFEQVRVALPATLDVAFRALVAPGVGQLMPVSQGLLDPLFRTLARSRRECLSRLRARLHDIHHDTTRELFASAVFLTPQLMKVIVGLFGELLEAHERWIGARLDEEQRQHAEVLARQQPALDLVATLAEEESSLARLLEASAS
jgi:hypothetical protein